MHTLNTPSAGHIAKRDKVAFVQACWHRDIVDRLRDSFSKEFSENSDKHVDYHEVPGAFEIPLYASTLAASGEYAAVVAAGLVVDGGIYRHEFVATAVIDGLMRAQLDSGMPILSAVLTPHHFHAGQEHLDFFAEHFEIKGKEVARACVQTLGKLSQIA